MQEKKITFWQLRNKINSDIKAVTDGPEICPRCGFNTLWPQKYREFNCTSSRTGDRICIACAVEERCNIEPPARSPESSRERSENPLYNRFGPHGFNPENCT